MKQKQEIQLLQFNQKKTNNPIKLWVKNLHSTLQKKIYKCP